MCTPAKVPLPNTLAQEPHIHPSEGGMCRGGRTGRGQGHCPRTRFLANAAVVEELVWPSHSGQAEGKKGRGVSAGESSSLPALWLSPPLGYHTVVPVPTGKQVTAQWDGDPSTHHTPHHGGGTLRARRLRRSGNTHHPGHPGSTPMTIAMPPLHATPPGTRGKRK